MNDIVDGNMSHDELVQKYGDDIVYDTIRRVNVNEFKRRQGSPAIKVARKTFGIGRRMPMYHKWK